MSISRKQFLQNMGLALGGVVLFRQNIFAEIKTKQLPPGCPGDFCNVDLTSNTPPFSAISQTSTPINYGKSNSHHKDVYYSDEHHSCTHASTNCELDGDSALLYQVYYPAKGSLAGEYDYANCPPLPAVIYAHQGGFSDCSDYTGGQVTTICREFAKRGFVCFNVEYRRGTIDDNLHQFNTYVNDTSVQRELAGYRASQDIRGAIRSIIKRQKKQGIAFNDEYQIDINQIFLAGTSAGAAAMLSVGYFPTQAFMDQVNPIQSGNTISNVLGGIDADYYYGNNDIEYLSKIKGIFSMWGSISVPYSVYNNHTEASFFSGVNNPPPVISFHGRNDHTFDYQFQNLKFTPRPTSVTIEDFHSESHCLLAAPFVTENDNTNVDLVTYGSAGIYYNVLQSLGVFGELYLDSGFGHGIGNNGSGYTGFGTGITKTSDLLTYMVKRAATFFQARIAGIDSKLRDCPAIHKVFDDCENRRKKCEICNHDCQTDDCPSGCQ